MTNVLIRGKTFHVRGELRALGGRWNATEKAWEVPADKAAEAQTLADRGKALAGQERAAKAAATRKANAERKAREDADRKARADALAAARAAYKLGDDCCSKYTQAARCYDGATAQKSWERCLSMLQPGAEFNVCTNFMFDRGSIWRVRVNEQRQAIVVGVGDWWAMSVNLPDSKVYEGADKGKVLGVAIIVRNSGCEGYHMAVDCGYNSKLDEGQG